MKKTHWLPFKECRDYIRDLEFNNPKEFRAWSSTYRTKGTWVSWDDYLSK